MPAVGRHVIDAAFVLLGASSHDISQHVESVEVIPKALPPVTVTAMQDGNVRRLPARINDYSVKLNLFQDYTTDSTGDVFLVLKAILAGNALVPFTIRPSSSSQSQSNPQFSGTAAWDGSGLPMLGVASPGAANKTSITLLGDGALTIASSS